MCNNYTKQMLIGIIGRRRVGKDTCADYLINKYGFAKIAFADTLKDACKVLFGFSDYDVNDGKDDINVKWGVTPRTMLKYIGTNVFRNDINRVIPWVNDNFWVMRCVDKYYEMNMNSNIIISDVRHQNEIDEIKRNNGILIKIINENVTKDSDEDHVDMLVGDYVIINNNDAKFFDDVELVYKSI